MARLKQLTGTLLGPPANLRGLLWLIFLTYWPTAYVINGVAPWWAAFLAGTLVAFGTSGILCPVIAYLQEWASLPAGRKRNQDAQSHTRFS